ISAALLSLSFTSSALAADEKVETVLVSATRSEGPQMPVATQITVIDAEQIRVSGATTVAEVLRTQAGIQIIDADGSGGRN
ncbi:TonB-dependent receptor plug domain-containing protein, partial [Fusobacterium mortiferum]|uniref:TonB-dependent receptor plug domain-containing protein n=1 Tax=Fusobacterium mortiferum TaxID=850 RepID=UPI001958C169|nr:TonB-dependent receptor plug domain-containing protein [Fusobacterium mortiferum]